MVLDIYTDGSRDNELKCGGWGLLLFTKDNKYEASGYEIHTTINAMELRAIHEALLYVKNIILPRGYKITQINLHTDSKYCVGYIQPYKAQQLLNSDLLGVQSKLHNKSTLRDVLIILLQFQELGIRFTVYKDTGHSNNPYNDYVNSLAISARKKCEELYFRRV